MLYIYMAASHLYLSTETITSTGAKLRNKVCFLWSCVVFFLIKMFAFVVGVACCAHLFCLCYATSDFFVLLLIKMFVFVVGVACGAKTLMYFAQKVTCSCYLLWKCLRLSWVWPAALKSCCILRLKWRFHVFWLLGRPQGQKVRAFVSQKQ